MISQFLSEEECDHMIQVARPNLIASKVVDENNKGEVIDNRRTSRGFFMHNHWNDPILIGIEKRIAAVTGMPIENGEDFHVLRYGVGEEYQPHYDYFNAATPGGSECLLRGGQRVASLIIYLHAPDAGGETLFPRPHIFITPRKGDAVLFYNCTPNGMVDPQSLHGGAPVQAGEKWIMTKWIRERAFQ
jgi:prolyl 4-hydroxylase